MVSSKKNEILQAWLDTLWAKNYFVTTVEHKLIPHFHFHSCKNVVHCSNAKLVQKSSTGMNIFENIFSNTIQSDVKQYGQYSCLSTKLSHMSD